MDTLTLELPTPLVSQMAELRIPTARIHSFVVQELEAWVGRLAKSRSKEEGDIEQTAEAQPLFSESAVPFIDQFITENQGLFEELAKL